MKKTTLQFLFLLLPLLIQAQNFGEITFNKAVNISGKQRMLGQRMSKAYISLLDNPSDEKAKKELVAAKVLFEKQNKILSKNSSSKATLNKITNVEGTWQELKPIFEASPNLEGAKIILEKNSELLKKSDDVVKSIIADVTNTQKLSKEKAGKNIQLKETINISGKQRMLSQRLALYYFSNSDKLKSENAMKTFQETYDNFDKAIKKLLTTEFNTEEIKNLLGVAMRDWHELKKYKQDFFTHHFPHEEVYKRTNDLMTTFNKLTGMYEKVSL